VLRIARRPRLASPPPAAGFDWYFCPQAGAFSHLVLVAGQQPLGHWVLPAVGGAPVPITGLWLQVAPGLGLARPVAHGAGCRGTGAALRPATSPLAQAIGGGLVLHLPAAADGLRQLYWLRPLQPGSASWLLSCGRPHNLHY
jgi:hypothetical protein